MIIGARGSSFQRPGGRNLAGRIETRPNLQTFSGNGVFNTNMYSVGANGAPNLLAQENPERTINEMKKKERHHKEVINNLQKKLKNLEEKN